MIPALHSRLRVLWFVAKPLPEVCERLGLPPLHRHGWLDALEVALRGSGIDLAIACFAPSRVSPFVSNGVKYYTMAASANNFRRRLVRACEARAYIAPDLSPCDAVVADFSPSVIHIHGTESPFGLGIPRWPVPSVVSIQGVLSSYAELDGRGRDRDAWLTMSPTLAAKDTGIAGAARRLRRLARREWAVVSNCDNFMGRTAYDHDFLRAVKQSFSYFHCDEVLRPPFWERSWGGPRDGGRTIACGGGDYSRKGHATALDALSVLRSAVGLDVTLRVVGGVPGPEGVRALARHARRVNVSEYVHPTGMLDASGITAELAAADVFILPTHADNSPNSLCEAMAVGTPVVASAAGGIPSMAADETEALLVQDGDCYALAGAIRRILDDADLAQRLSLNAKRRALARHDPSSVAAQVIAAYEAVAAGNGTAG